MSLITSRKGVLENFFVLIAVLMIDIIVGVTTIGIGGASVEHGFDYYDAALEQSLERIYLSESCFAYNDGAHTNIGILDKSKINSERLQTCLKNEFLGVRVALNDNITLFNDEFASTNSSCVVVSKPYSCGKKEIRLLVFDGEKYEKTDLRIEGVLKHA